MKFRKQRFFLHRREIIGITTATRRSPLYHPNIFAGTQEKNRVESFIIPGFRLRRTVKVLIIIDFPASSIVAERTLEGICRLNWEISFCKQFLSH